jgi:uncharacterized lipoprotein
MNKGAAYDRALRAIGQALEGQEFKVVDVKSSGEDFIVSGDPAKITALQALLAKWQGRHLRRKGAFQMSYTLKDIARLDYTGRTRRSGATRTPDFHSLSSLLRTVGAYLDRKGALLLQVHKQDNTVTIVYQAEQGHPKIEERSVASFYYLFSEMHRRRKKGQN